MNAPQNPLDQLRDIHLPQSIDSFQLAPGWWVLIALSALTIYYIVKRWNKRRKITRYLKPALVELEFIAKLSPDNHSLEKLSALLKRVCLLYYPKKQVAHLSGKLWVEFLNQQASNELFDDQQMNIFTQVIYQPNVNIEANLWQLITNNSKTVIKVMIKKAAKGQLS